MTLGWLAISGKGASVTFDTKGLLVEVAKGVEGAKGEAWGGELGGLVWDVGEAGVALVMLATERRPELCCAPEKFRPPRRLMAKNRSIRGYMKKS
jgi:hypothetical protein